LLQRWDEAIPLFRKVMPRDYARALVDLAAKDDAATEATTDASPAVTVSTSRRGRGA
jgi:glutamate synthase domain-containing protein 3